MIFLTISAGVLLLLFTSVLRLLNHYGSWKNINSPYEEPSFLFGNVKSVWKKTDHFGGCMLKIYEKFKGKASFVGIFIFWKSAALIIDLDLVRHLLITHFGHFHDRGVFYNEKDDPVSAHLFALSGPRWRLLRNKVSPIFSSGKMKRIFPIAVEIAKRFEVKLEEVSKEGVECDIKGLMARLIVTVIGVCTFGFDCKSIADESSELYRVGMSVINNPRSSFSTELLMLSFRNFARKIGCKRFRDEVGEFYRRIVRSILDYRIVRCEDFMQHLIDLYQTEGGDKITFNEVLAQAFIFSVAGSETTTRTLQFCFYELARNQEIQKKTREHINQVLAKYNGELTYEAVKEMKYVDQVINETLRLYPPVMTLFREATKDYTVPGTNYILKKGVSVIIPVFAIHRDPVIYPYPLQFDPERFSEENMKTRPSMAFLPFGKGPRMCIGARLGIIQIQVALITALRRFEYSLSSKTEEPLRLSENSFVTVPVGDVWLKIERINDFDCK